MIVILFFMYNKKNSELKNLQRNIILFETTIVSKFLTKVHK